mmetsp:Transcript_9673/g.24115  ORF Transcript_9673/g.24115 Transcript_9673/m.24115 type:complete len:232 (-) Transcript_9673:1275-1970(-)
MTSINRSTSSNNNAVVSLVSVVFLVMLFEVEKVGAFLFRSHHLPPVTLTAQTRYDAYSSTSLKANVVPVTDSNYRELFQGEKPLLLDACAPWCGPCKLIEPLLEQCAEDWKDSLVVGKFDVEDAAGKNGNSRDLKVELILQGAMPQALPALILVHNNKVLDTWKGVISPDQLQEMLEKNIVETKGVVDSNASKEKSMAHECGVQRNVFETIDNLDNKKAKSFRGIGLVNNF